MHNIDQPASAHSNTEYVYALSRTPATTDNDPRNIFYIGKGSTLRWEQHFNLTRKKMRQAEADSSIELNAKEKVIESLFLTYGDDLDIEQHAYMVVLDVPTSFAFEVEAILIKLFRQFGVELTNAERGHYEGHYFTPASEVRRFMGSERVKVTAIPGSSSLEDYLPGGRHGSEEVCVVVKGASDPFGLRKDVIHDSPGRFDGSVQADSAEVDRTTLRRGWEPDRPWSDEEARERARHYWKVAPQNASKLRIIAEDGRLHLALGVKDPRSGRTVVRYKRRVTTNKPWLDYGNSIGFELGEASNETTDPWLGKSLINQLTGLQVLKYRSQGITYVSLGDARRG